MTPAQKDIRWNMLQNILVESLSNEEQQEFSDIIEQIISKVQARTISTEPFERKIPIPPHRTGASPQE